MVDLTYRGRGVGRRLVQAAEAWASARGLDQMAVRSNVGRAESHPFYERLGYVRAKTQHAYRKRLRALAPPPGHAEVTRTARVWQDRFGATDPEEEMNPRFLLLILLVLSFAATVAHAQQAPLPLRPGPARLLWERPSSALSAESARAPLGGLLGPDDLDHRYPGFFVGAGLGLLMTA